ncbi:efflux RND transporter periplasmic adaptor subunit [Deltaproteobacteria bacterium TL4]
MKKILILILIGIVGGGAAFWHYKKTPRSDEKKKQLTIKVERAPIKLTVSSTGRVVAYLEVEIKSKANGEIIQLPYDISDSVKKGDLLVELDPSDEERNVKQAQIALSISQAKMEQVRLGLLIAEKDAVHERQRRQIALELAQAKTQDIQTKADRIKLLMDKKLTSQEEYDTALTSAIQVQADLQTAKIQMDELATQELALDVKRQDVILAQASLESDKITLSTVQQRLADTRVVSPINGVITSRSVQVGQIISSGINSVSGGTSILKISDLTRLFILAAVDESDIGKLKIGCPVQITTDAFPNISFRGKVVRIATQGVNVSNVVTFEVQIEVSGKNKSLLKSEMTANLEIIAEEKEEALLVPAEAVFRVHKQPMVKVVKEDKTIEERPVETGINDGVQVEIIKGLNEGEIIHTTKGAAESRWRKDDQNGQERPGRRMFLGH